MIRRISSVLGFASLVALGTPATAYADSLPATAGHSYNEAYDSCFYAMPGTFVVTNICNQPGPLPFVIPVQSRATGAFTFYATGTSGPNTTGAGLQCWIVGEDFYGNAQFSGSSSTVNGQVAFMSLGRYTVSSNSVLYYYCNLPYNAQLYDVVWNP